MTFEIRDLAKKWFAETYPKNYAAKAKFVITAGDSEIVILHDDQTTTDKVTVVLPAVTGDLAVTYSDGEITITLANTDGTATTAANTVALIAAALNAVVGKKWTATATGTGSVAAAAAEAAFTNGGDGTPCPVKDMGLYDSATENYYVCTEANNTTKNAGWKKFKLEEL